MYTTQYENFVMKKGKTIFSMNSNFTAIINELRGLENPFKFTRKFARFSNFILKYEKSRWMQSQKRRI